MQNESIYSLPKLDYGFSELEPHISSAQLQFHYEKHHNAYVTATNSLSESLQKSRKENTVLDMKGLLKSLSFNLSGHILHSLFWKNMSPVNKGGGGEPEKEIAEAINNEFGSFERFKAEFKDTALSVEGSGWAALVYCPFSKKLLLVQIEKHNVNLLPESRILLILDVFEHAYYIDYKNERTKFTDSFFNIINWNEVNRRYTES